jgi:imidazolonepropionase-like amidohydrolase
MWGALTPRPPRSRECKRQCSVPETMNLYLTRAFLFCLVIASAQARPLALVGGRLIDGFGGHPLANSVIVIENERIAAVGTVGELKVPADAEVISTEGMDVLPGLWDCHVHTMLLGHSDYDHWDKTYPARYNEIMAAASHQLLPARAISAAR